MRYEGQETTNEGFKPENSRPFPGSVAEASRDAPVGRLQMHQSRATKVKDRILAERIRGWRRRRQLVETRDLVPLRRGRVSLAKKENGEAIVEFALLAPVIILLLFAMVDFGRIFDAWLVATNAAREGARYATVYSTKDYISDSEVVQMTQEKAYDYLAGGLGSRSDVSYTISDIAVTMPGVRSAQPVTVDVSVRVQVWALLNIFMSNQTTVRGSATMRI